MRIDTSTAAVLDTAASSQTQPVQKTEETVRENRPADRVVMSGELPSQQKAAPAYSPLEMGPRITLKEDEALAEIPRNEPTAQERIF